MTQITSSYFYLISAYESNCPMWLSCIYFQVTISNSSHIMSFLKTLFLYPNQLTPNTLLCAGMEMIPPSVIYSDRYLGHFKTITQKLLKHTPCKGFLYKYTTISSIRKYQILTHTWYTWSFIKNLYWSAVFFGWNMFYYWHPTELHYCFYGAEKLNLDQNHVHLWSDTSIPFWLLRHPHQLVMTLLISRYSFIYIW